MARIKVINTEDELTLDELIPVYAENKDTLDTYKKTCDKQNKQIKDLMETDTYEVAGYKATVSTSTRDSINEEQLLSILKEYPMAYEEDIIKVKEYVDMDSLESAIYNGKVGNDILMQIDKCRETKEITTLRVTKIKEKK